MWMKWNLNVDAMVSTVTVFVHLIKSPGIYHKAPTRFLLPSHALIITRVSRLEFSQHWLNGFYFTACMHLMNGGRNVLLAQHHSCARMTIAHHTSRMITPEILFIVGHAFCESTRCTWTEHWCRLSASVRLAPWQTRTYNPTSMAQQKM
jgi:hypothetical protein